MSSSGQTPLRTKDRFSPDALSTYTDRPSPASSSTQLGPPRPTMSDGVTGPPSPEPLSTRESTSSTELSAVLAKPPTSASPMPERDTIELKQSQVAAANAKEATARRELAEARRAESAHKKAAQKQRQEAKDLQAHCKKLRAEIKALQPKIKGLKADADRDDDIAKRENSFLYDLEEEVEVKEAARKKLESKLEDLQHEKMLHEKMLHDKYPDPVIRKLVETMDENKALAKILETFWWGWQTLEGLEILEAQLEDISSGIPTAQENGQGSEKNGSPDEDVEGVKAENEDRREEDLEAGEGVSRNTGMGSEKEKEDKKGKPNVTVLKSNDAAMSLRWRTWCKENTDPIRPSSSGNSASPSPSQQPTAALSRPKTNIDQVTSIMMLATRVTMVSTVEEWINAVALSKASKEQLKQLQGLIDELKGIIRRQQAEKEQGKPSSRTGNDCSSAINCSSTTTDPTQSPIEQVPDGDGDSDGVVGSKMAESAPEPAIGRKDISNKSETGAKVEADLKEHDWRTRSALAESELRNQLQMAREFCSNTSKNDPPSSAGLSTGRSRRTRKTLPPAATHQPDTPKSSSRLGGGMKGGGSAKVRSTKVRSTKVRSTKVRSAKVRSANVCNQCRAKRLKCDGVRPMCTPCQNAGIVCSLSVDDENEDREQPKADEEEEGQPDITGAPQGLQAQARHLMGGKRKRESEDV